MLVVPIDLLGGCSRYRLSRGVSTPRIGQLVGQSISPESASGQTVTPSSKVSQGRVAATGSGRSKLISARIMVWVRREAFDQSKSLAPFNTADCGNYLIVDHSVQQLLNGLRSLAIFHVVAKDCPRFQKRIDQDLIISARRFDRQGFRFFKRPLHRDPIRIMCLKPALVVPSSSLRGKSNPSRRGTRPRSRL